MISKSDRTRCNGCSACSVVCPVGCISMKADEEGFSYPVVCEENCVHCGKCDSVCAVEQYRISVAEEPTAWGAIANAEDIRFDSSSGGLFSVLAENVLNKNGIVCGAVMSEDCKHVQHVIVDSETHINRLRGSKYLQSNVGDIYKKIEILLENGKTVLFSGTPCQIAGLKSSIGKKNESLLCVGIFCHGVPSPKLWKKYAEFCEQKTGSSIEKVQFRNKKNGWSNFGLRLSFKDGSEAFKTADRDMYMRMFLRNYSLRPSCYQCSFKGNTCGADLMIGDFWGVKEVVDDLDDDLGTSLVLSYTPRGHKALDSIKNELHLCSVEYENAVKGNGAYLASVSMPECRMEFFEDMNSMDFASLAEKYVPFTAKEHIKIMLKKMHLLGLACKILGK